MSEFLHKSHNVSVLLYHIVCPAKYRRGVISDEVDNAIKEICKEIEKRYGIRFLETGTEKDHERFLVQSIPSYSPTRIVTKIKSILAREIYVKHPEVKKKLWGGGFWSDGYFIGTVSKYGNEEAIKLCDIRRDRKELQRTIQKSTGCTNVVITRQLSPNETEC